MSDTRFTMIGIGLIFAGFIVLGVFGSEFFDASIQAEEFDNCFEYFDDRPPVQVDCDIALQDKSAFFGLVVGLIAAGVISLIKGVKGNWDQKVKPEDMLGPGGERNTSSDNEDNPRPPDDQK